MNVVFSSAEEAVRKGDVDYRGTTLRIEVARSGGPPSSNYSRGMGRGSRSPYRVLVKGLPLSASWQDVKVNMVVTELTRRSCFVILLESLRPRCAFVRSCGGWALLVAS